MTKDDPADPVTPLLAMASQMHEMLSAYVTAGFTRAEAMQIVVALMVEGVRAGSQGTSPDGS